MRKICPNLFRIGYICDPEIRLVLGPKFTLIFFLFLILFSGKLFAQKEDSVTSDKDKLISVSVGKPKFSPFIAPTYAPATEFMVTAGGLFTFKFRPLDSLVQRSSVPFSIGYSTNGSFALNVRPAVFGHADRYRVLGDIALRDMQDNYFGVGYQNGRNTPRGDSTTAYQRYWWMVNIDFLRQVVGKFYAGITLDLNKTRASEQAPLMRSDPNVIQFGKQLKNSGLGVIFQYDTRDLGINAYSGYLLSFKARFYGQFLGGDNIYQLYELDYRQYKQIKREGSTLAWQTKFRKTTGSVPWPENSQLGTPFDLRAYRWGQYRDKTMLFGIVEYRYMFMQKKPNRWGSYMSRHGVVGWIAGGSIAPRITQMDRWLPNAGLGYRFAVQPRMNARVDFGIGTESYGFYISFNEAF